MTREIDIDADKGKTEADKSIEKPEADGGEKKKKAAVVQEKQMINVSTTARMFGISAKTLRKWCTRGWISYYNQANSHRKFKLSEVEEYLEKIHVVPKKPLE